MKGFVATVKMVDEGDVGVSADGLAVGVPAQKVAVIITSHDSEEARRTKVSSHAA